MFENLRAEFTYPNGFADLVGYIPDNRPGYDGMQSLLEELTKDGIAPLVEQMTAAPDPALLARIPDPVRDARDKYALLQRDFVDQPQILTLHALTIAASRNGDAPAIARETFVEIWRQHAAFLLKTLSPRWQISALQTFRSFGENEAQRRCASEMTVLFSLSKLYESERLYSGLKSKENFDIETRAKGGILFKLPIFSLRAGDLDRNLLGLLWDRAERDPVLRPLACRLLTELNRDNANIFRRLRLMRRAYKRRDAG